MAVKLTILGMLIYAAMGAYVVAFVLTAFRLKRAGKCIYAAGFAVALGTVVLRGIEVGHMPLKNLFEVLLFLGMLVFPLSVFSRKVLGVGGLMWDMLIGAAVLFPAGFVFDASPSRLMPALQSPLFVPHVLCYVTAYVILAKAAGLAGMHVLLGDRTRSSESESAHRLMCLGFPLLTFGLVLGAWWGKLAWGDYWNWDPKEMWSLAAWLIHLGYFHFRAMHGHRHTRAGVGFIIAGTSVNIITLLWVNLSMLFAGMHSYA